jgi:UDP-2,3-diacylglucosamine hydrolase
MLKDFEHLPDGKKVYFASDFHLGASYIGANRKREKIIVKWLDTVKEDAHSIILLGDIFDFWFEYKHVIPKGFIRLQGKLVELADNGINIAFFTGNHDMWMFDYFPTELGIRVFKHPMSMRINSVKILMGHGDGLGPGDHKYKFLKKVFENRFLQWAFSKIHPNLGIGVARRWSDHSREYSMSQERQFMGNDELIFRYCQKMEMDNHHDYYIFGHRHLPMDVEINENSRYINVGEWISHYTYGIFDGVKVRLQSFKDEAELVGADYLD